MAMLLRNMTAFHVLKLSSSQAYNRSLWCEKGWLHTQYQSLSLRPCDPTAQASFVFVACLASSNYFRTHFGVVVVTTQHARLSCAATDYNSHNGVCTPHMEQTSSARSRAVKCHTWWTMSSTIPSRKNEPTWQITSICIFLSFAEAFGT